MKDDKTLTKSQISLVIVLYLVVMTLGVLLVLNLKKQKEVIIENIEDSNKESIKEVVPTYDEKQIQVGEETLSNEDSTTSNKAQEESLSDDSNNEVESDIYNFMRQ